MHNTDPDIVFRQALVFNGSNTPPSIQDVAVVKDRIVSVSDSCPVSGKTEVDASGFALAPGFIDVHTHDDIEVIRNPGMLNKLSQGVTTVITGNCGISASPVAVNGELPDPLNLLGETSEFCFPTMKAYIGAVEAAKPNVNVAALVGHTALRAQAMDNLSRSATPSELAQMQKQLHQAMRDGALGLSTGLAYASANCADSDEVEALASVLQTYNGIYTTHLRTEFNGIIDALDEAFSLGRKLNLSVVISHLKCAGKANWGRASEVLAHLQQAQKDQHIGCDCYPYSASSSTLDLNQVTDDFDIDITWSEPHPEMAGKTLKAIASEWQLSLIEAAQKLQPAGAVYHGMDEGDVRQFLSFEKSMIGSDGLPCDPSPHPRLWGSFPRVLGHYARDESLMPLHLAIHKMTALSCAEFGLIDRGRIQAGFYADLVLFCPQTIIDNASFTSPKQRSSGIAGVWVNGCKTYHTNGSQFALRDVGAGRFLTRQST